MIYCVEDDQSIRDLMLYTLNTAGFSANGFPDSVPFWDAMKQETPELILLDIMLPGDDGIAILKELKASPLTRNIPVIMATAKDSEYDKVIGLDLGADDYLSKPCGMMEMISCIKAVLRRTTPKEDAPVLMCGGITLNTVKHQVSVHDQPVTLTLKEYELLRTFMENLGKAFTREQLLSSIWGIDFVGETRTVDVHIGTLRTKLGSCGGMIATVRALRYRMEDNGEKENYTLHLDGFHPGADRLPDYHHGGIVRLRGYHAARAAGGRNPSGCQGRGTERQKISS